MTADHPPARQAADTGAAFPSDDVLLVKQRAADVIPLGARTARTEGDGASPAVEIDENGEEWFPL